MFWRLWELTLLVLFLMSLCTGVKHAWPAGNPTQTSRPAENKWSRLSSPRAGQLLYDLSRLQVTLVPDIYVHTCKIQLLWRTDVFFLVFNSEAHVSAWLHLKANLAPSKVKEIKKTFSDFQTSECIGDSHDHLSSSSNFFSKVVIV